MGIITKLFGTHSEREIKRITSLVNKTEELSDHYSGMTDEELKAQTQLFKDRLAKGETLDDILPEAFATVREASTRVLGKRHYRVQLIGGIIIHQGRIAEMRTGEGKTLVATLPAYLNALTGKGVHIVTVNDYLAKRDSEWMGKIYNFLGLTVGLVVHGQSPEEKHKAYDADITYGTNNEFGFDYLRDNLVIYKEDRVQRGHNFAIVDEVDSILIDEARTPLIISGQGEKSTELYGVVNAFAKTLKSFKIKEANDKEIDENLETNYDYIIDEKANNATLTSRGIKKVEEQFGIDNFADPENAALAHHVNQAIKALGTMKRDVDYVVKDNQVIIVDAFTGRLMPGRRYSDGLHQAIEAKENVKVERESKTLATITFQNFFRLYTKLSGMTGTALTEEGEFREIYNLDVIVIPTNKPMIRKDAEDKVFKNSRGKINAIVAQIEECHKKGQPVLVGTVSIDKSEELSKILQKRGIPHNVLNAKFHEKEAEIIAQAGKYGAVTISTNMAGRGTDIMLGGNPEYLAKTKLRQEGYSEELIVLADTVTDTDNEEIIGVRARYNELVAEFEREIAPEREKVREAGGLFILGTERHESRRIDNQLRGRAGRQGDSGASAFYLSLDDDLMRLFGGDRIVGVVDRLGLEDDQPIDARILSNTIENAQKRLEGQNFARRRNVLMYDNVMSEQRNVIYKERGEVLDGIDLTDKIKSMMHSMIESKVRECMRGDTPDQWQLDELRRAFFGLFTTDADFRETGDALDELSADKVTHELCERADKLYAEKTELLGEEVMSEAERVILLRTVDRKWMAHIDAMDALQSTIRLQAYGQRDPVREYKIVGSDMFDEMTEEIRCDTVRGILSVQPRTEIKREKVAKITGASHGGDASPVKKAPVRKAESEKVGRNDPCPCGSGLKYKKCCGKNMADGE
ncbi:MAG: preprotein translocase subunit SecA [Clostridia bacterium]|nr:preprotein translocase subunit SecA [Clostridia bacterium]MBQ7897791.1 preprotein translocase subunit SecA [Clostridia bacterium]